MDIRSTSLWRSIVHLDRKINHCLGGYKDETISSRSYRGRARGNVGWALVEILINCILFIDREKDFHKHTIFHCELSFIREVEYHHSLLFPLSH